MKKIFVVALLVTGLTVQAQTDLRWTMVQPGIWKMRIGTPVSILGMLQNVPDSAALGRLPAVGFPLPEREIFARVEHGSVPPQLNCVPSSSSVAVHRQPMPVMCPSPGP